jgi:hypothetical protein
MLDLGGQVFHLAKYYLKFSNPFFLPSLGQGGYGGGGY